MDGFNCTNGDEQQLCTNSDDKYETRYYCYKKKQKREGRRKQTRMTSEAQAAVSVDLTVVGVPCRLHRSDDMSRSLAGGDHLINFYEGRDTEDCDETLADDDGCWIVDGSEEEENDDSRPPSTEVTKITSNAKKPPTLMIDRYDARTLIDDYHSIHFKTNNDVSKKKHDEYLKLVETNEEERQLHYERYGLLASEFKHFISKENHTEEKIDEPHNNSNTQMLDESKNNNKEEPEPFDLTEEEKKWMPAGMIMPSTKREGDIIRMTAARSATAPQFEVLLKLKQASNPDFAFLQSCHALHPFYLLFKDRVSSGGATTSIGTDTNKNNEPLNPGLVDYASSSTSTSDNDDAATSNNNAMSGLVGIYSSSPSDDDDDDSCGGSLLLKGETVKKPSKDELLPVSNVKKKSQASHNPETTDIPCRQEDRVAEPGQFHKSTGSNLPACRLFSNDDDDSSKVQQLSNSRHDETTTTTELEEGSKARRLKRAKMMKGHYALKMMDQS